MIAKIKNYFFFHPTESHISRSFTSANCGGAKIISPFSSFSEAAEGVIHYHTATTTTATATMTTTATTTTAAW